MSTMFFYFFIFQYNVCIFYVRMRRFFQIIRRINIVFLVIIMMSSVVVIANTLWPSQPPTWEAPGGVLKTYFQNIIGRCDGNKVLVAINKATGIKECANANSLISATNFGLCPANNSYPKLDFTFGSSSVSSKIRLIWSSENTTQCSIHGISTTATGWSVDVPANNNSYTLSCSGADGSSVSQTLNTTSIWVVGGGIAWPTMNPSGESTWGIFGNYLSNLGWEIGKCSSNEVIVGFEANGKPKCVVASSLMSASSCPGSSDPYINFTATPSNIAPWDPVTLAWQAGNLTSCTTSDAFVVNGSSSWTTLIHPTTTATYRITCSDDTGRQMQKSVSVTVTPPPIPGGWSSFGTCQASCTKTRTCTNPTPQNGWLTCQNDSQGGATVSCYGGSCAPICGNGFQESGEVCDSGSNNGQVGYCNQTCSALPICGDGMKNQALEICDDWLKNGVTPGYCNAQCTGYTSWLWFILRVNEFTTFGVLNINNFYNEITFSESNPAYFGSIYTSQQCRPGYMDNEPYILWLDVSENWQLKFPNPFSTKIENSNEYQAQCLLYDSFRTVKINKVWMLKNKNVSIDLDWIIPKNYKENGSCTILVTDWESTLYTSSDMIALSNKELKKPDFWNVINKRYTADLDILWARYIYGKKTISFNTGLWSMFCRQWDNYYCRIKLIVECDGWIATFRSLNWQHVIPSKDRKIIEWSMQ